MYENKYDTHVFVCESCSYKKDGNSCHPDTAKILRKRVKEICAGEVDRKRLRINGSGCLGHCEQGIAAVIYPEGQWLNSLREGDEYKLAKAALASYKRSKS